MLSDRHAYLETAQFYNDRSGLKDLPWLAWQARDFTRDHDDPSKFECYQAEALVYKHVPLEAFCGIVCYTQIEKKVLLKMEEERGLGLSVYSRESWYF